MHGREYAKPYKRVKRNKGVSGIEVGEYAEWYTRLGDFYGFPY
jgi:hypothetical protein